MTVDEKRNLIGTIQGDMKILDAFIKPRVSNGVTYNDVYYKIRCERCGTEREVYSVPFLNGVGQKHNLVLETKQLPSSLDDPKYIGQTFGDMTITGTSRHLDEKYNYNVADYNVHCNVCGIDRKVNAVSFIAGEGITHGRPCSKAITDHPELAMQRDFGDAKVIDTDFYKQKNGKAENYFVIKCNVCGKEKKVKARDFLIPGGYKHADSCVPQIKQKYQIVIGSLIGDMRVLAINNPGHNATVKVKCEVCGAERTCTKQRLSDGNGIKHGFACNYGNEHRYDDRVGKRFGDYVVDRVFKKDAWWYAHAHCTICGNEKDIRMEHLHAGDGTSHIFCTMAKYPRRFSKIYWGIIARTQYTSNMYYKDYGGRGIKCEWPDLKSFADDMLEPYLEACKVYGDRNPSIERIDVNGNYCKSNCKWIHIKDQQNNQRFTLYFKLFDPAGNIHCSRSLRNFCTRYGLENEQIRQVLIGNKESHNGWRGHLITPKEYNEFWSHYHAEHLDGVIDILNNLYNTYKDDPDKLYEAGVRINYGLFRNAYANGDLCNEEIDIICNRENKYGLQITYDPGRKCFFIDDVDSESLAA